MPELYGNIVTRIRTSTATTTHPTNNALNSRLMHNAA